MEADMQTISFRQLGAIVATIALALAILSIPYAVHSQRVANLPDANPVVALAPAPALIEHSLTDTGDIAFGFLVFDWDPRAPGGVPGFDQWIPTAQPNAPAARAQVE
jgi:hypothetical protein